MLKTTIIIVRFQRAPRKKFSCTSNFPPISPRGFPGVPGTTGVFNPSSVSLVYPGVASRLDVPGTPPEGGARGASSPDAQTTFSNIWKSSDSTEVLLDFQNPHLVMEGTPHHLRNPILAAFIPKLTLTHTAQSLRPLVREGSKIDLKN